MLPEELIDMAKQVRMQKCESNRLEIKAAREGCPKRLYDTLSGFSNQDDGGCSGSAKEAGRAVYANGAGTASALYHSGMEWKNPRQCGNTRIGYGSASLLL